jgi:uncharacterized protein
VEKTIHPPETSVLSCEVFIMTEQDNITLVKKLYSAFAHGDVQTILAHLTDDVDWILDGPAEIPYAGRRSGTSEVRAFFEALGSTQDSPALTIDDYIAQGDRVATVGRYSAIVRATGKKIDCAVAHIFTIRGGQVAKFLDFGDTAQMAEAYKSALSASR